MPRFYLIVGFLLAVGIYLIYLIIVVRKKKTKIFHDQMEPKLAERRYKMLKTFLLVAIISFVVIIVDFILAFTLFSLLEPVVSVCLNIVVPVALGVFVIATIGSQVIFLKGRRKTT